jgi:hypothetical protein
MNNNPSLKRRIMAHIYFEYTKNAFLEYPDYFMFALFVATTFALVSISDVFVNITNVPRDHLSNFFNFAFIALRDTSWIIQALIAGFLVRVAVSGVRKSYKNINTHWIESSLSKFRY